MKILVTGANGMVARATVEHCLAMGDEVIALTREQLDIANKEQVRDELRRARCHTVINCAAWTDVDACETDAERNYAANARGPENLAIVCRDIQANLVTISTDYVFDGSKQGPYTQRDDPAPISEYGRAKLQGEHLARAALARTTIVRAGWIFGPGGTNFLSKVAGKLLRGVAVAAIADSYGTPTYAVDLAVRLRELAELDLPGIYHVANEGEGTSYAGFARAVAPDSKNISEVKSTALARPAERPVNSRLSCLVSPLVRLKGLRPWQTALSEFVETERSLLNV